MINFGIAILGFILTCCTNKKYIKGEFNEIPVKQLDSKIYSFTIYIIWITILIRGFVNFLIGVLEVLHLIHSQDIWSVNFNFLMI